MGIRVSGIDDVIRQLEEEIQKAQEDVIEGLSEVGRKVVSGVTSGETSNWNDQTGNLRSSIGYVVSLDGKVKAEGGFQSYGSADEGPGIGRTFAYGLASSYLQGAALIIVAGMDYSVYVEAMDNKTRTNL